MEQSNTGFVYQNLAYISLFPIHIGEDVNVCAFIYFDVHVLRLLGDIWHYYMKNWFY